MIQADMHVVQIPSFWLIRKLQPSTPCVPCVASGPSTSLEVDKRSQNHFAKEGHCERRRPSHGSGDTY